MLHQWQRDQAAQCPCKGSDDMCKCQNVQKGSCDECAEMRPLAETVGDYAVSFGHSHKVCKDCYESTPEPDTGRPDWEDLFEPA